MKLHSDLQFIPTQENVSLLLTRYGLEAASYELADSGIENRTVIIETGPSKYVLRIYRQHKKSDEDIQRELDFVAYLGNNGIPVASPIANLKGDFVTHMAQNDHIWQAILMQYILGNHPEHYSSKLLLNLAAIQAKMHTLADSYRAINTTGKDLTEIRETPFVQLIQNRESLDPPRQNFVSRAENYVVSLDSSLPRGLCHLDFDNNNVLSKDSDITAVLDFDDLAAAPYVMCMAYTAWDIAYDLGIGSVASYVAGYEKYRPLTTQEKDFLKPIMLFRHYMIGCISIAGNHMSDIKFAKYLEFESEFLGSWGAEW